MGLEIHEIGGNCPVQAEGQIDGFIFYFRARGSHWSLDVYNGGDEPWGYSEEYGVEPYAAGWMTEEEARAFIAKAAEQFRADHFTSPDTEDGQPDEQQEWRDFDPDC